MEFRQQIFIYYVQRNLGISFRVTNELKIKLKKEEQHGKV